MAKRKKLTSTLNPLTINSYLVKLSTLMNFAINEGLLDRNPFKGLKVADDVHPRDRRYPFSDDQLNKIFNAPIYRGCVNDENGYADVGNLQPRRGRFWIPLIGLFSGMRLNEVCQLDLKDVITMEGIACFSITPSSTLGEKDKRIKTVSSYRLVPVHRRLIEFGFLDYVAERRKNGSIKLFPELPISTTGYYSDPFSKWFVRFLKRCGAAKARTSYHSFRHLFRDRIRHAKLDHEIGQTLGGWSSATGKEAETSSIYGAGHGALALKEAIDRIDYPNLDLAHLRYPPDSEH
jgi:integrase